MCVSNAYLPTVATGEQDEDCARCDGGAQPPSVLGERLLAVAVQFAGDVLCGVVPGLRQHRGWGVLANVTNAAGRISGIFLIPKS